MGLAHQQIKHPNKTQPGQFVMQKSFNPINLPRVHDLGEEAAKVCSDVCALQSNEASMM
jgi:hypothetical protein